MPMRGRLIGVVKEVVRAGLSGSTSKPSIARFQTSGVVVTMAFGTPPGSGLLRFTFAPCLRRRLTMRAACAPLYGKRYVPPLLIAASGNFGRAVIFVSARLAGGGQFATGVLPLDCMAT